MGAVELIWPALTASAADDDERWADETRISIGRTADLDRERGAVSSRGDHAAAEKQKTCGIYECKERAESHTHSPSLSFWLFQSSKTETEFHLLPAGLK
jgi:hypothetical protein